MKTKKSGKTILALVLAVVMIALVPLGVWAEESDDSLGDLQYIHVDGTENASVGYYGDDKNGTHFTGEDEDGTIVTGAIKNDAESGFTPISIESHDATFSVTTEEITDTRETGRNKEAVAITAVGDKSDVTFTSEDITSKSIGLEINNGGEFRTETETTYVDGGKVTATTGDINSGYIGVRIINGNDGVDGNEDTTCTTTVTTGKITSGDEGVYITNNGGTVTVTTDTIDAIDTGVEIYSPSGNATTGTNDVTINGPLTVGANERSSRLYGIAVYDYSGFTDTVTANGNITVTGNEKCDADGIMVQYTNGNTTITTNASDITVSGRNAYGVNMTVYGNNDAGAEDAKPTVTTAILDGDITVKGESLAIGADFTTNKNGNLNATITGDTITAMVEAESEEEADTEGTEDEEKTKATALRLENKGGTMDVSVESDLVAKGADISTGVAVIAGGAEKWTIAEGTEPIALEGDLGEPEIKFIGGVEYEAYCVNEQWYVSVDDKYQKVTVEDLTSSTNLTITGNVTAEQVGLDLEIADGQEANIVVDGTVFGNDAGIVLRDETEIGDNLKLTVWEVVPDKNKAVIFREEKDEKDNITYKEDEEAEKLLQYIIKIEDNSADYITTSGTRDFEAGNGEKYQVANEGDTVLVKLTIPEGKELVGAYWDEGQTEAGKLLVDPDTGDYYVEVPRGGGVILSVVLKDVEPEPTPTPDPKPTPKPDVPGEKEPAAPAPAGVSTLLTLFDKTNEMRIILYSNGTYKAALSNKQVDYGTFAATDDHITLTSKTGKTLEITKDGSDWKLTFSGEGDKTYEFKISAEEMQGLVDALKK